MQKYNMKIIMKLILQKFKSSRIVKYTNLSPGKSQYTKNSINIRKKLVWERFYVYHIRYLLWIIK